VKNDRRVSLALSHARLTAAKDLVRWAMSAEAEQVLPQKDVWEVVEKLKKWADETWKALGKIR
jgi:hypothetical protein